MKLNIKNLRKVKKTKIISTEESLKDIIPMNWENNEVNKMKRELFSCPITLGEYENIIKNEKVYEQLNDEQKEWLGDFFNNSIYDMKNSRLKLQEGVLWVITNTKNSIREFERM